MKSENTKLKKTAEEYEKLTKRFSELEGKNEQLAETLKSANEKITDFGLIKKELEDAKKFSDNLEKKNSQLSATAKDNTAKLDEQKKQLAERDKHIAALEKEQSKTVTVIEENKRLSEKLEKAQNFEEAYHREDARANAAEKERDTLKVANEALRSQLEKVKSDSSGKESAELKTENEKLLERIADSEKKSEALYKDYEELSTAYDELDKQNKELAKSAECVRELEELKVKFSQIESENTALKSAEGGKEDLQKRLSEMKNQLEELNLKNAELTNDNKALKKTNSSLEKRLKEMLEDGQLTL